MNSTPDTLRIERTRDLSPNEHQPTMLFIYSASRIDGDMIGWMPRMAYDVRDTQGKLIVLFNNDDLVGFLMFSYNMLGEMRILQIWIRRDARMILHGRALIDWLDEESRTRGCHLVRLWCAIDLAANLFWRALHFHYVTWRWGGGTKSRRHALWVRPVTIVAWPGRPTERQRHSHALPT